MGTFGLMLAAYGVGGLVGFIGGVWYMAGEKSERYRGKH